MVEIRRQIHACKVASPFHLAQRHLTQISQMTQITFPAEYAENLYPPFLRYPSTTGENPCSPCNPCATVTYSTDFLTHIKNFTLT